MKGRSVEQVLDDPMAGDAIERCLERISEAAHRLHRAEVDLAALEPGIRWIDIRTFGNRLRHEYDAVDADLIGGILQSHLTELRAAAMRLQSRFDAQPPV